MFRDGSKIGNKDLEVMDIALSSKDGHKVKMIGEVTDKIYKNGVLVDTIVGHNLVVNDFVKLLMGAIKNDTTYGGGIQYWAVGSGNTNWDSALPDPELGATQLTNELGRVQIYPEDIVFLTSDYETSNTPTNIIQITKSFAEGDCNGAWREFGIFGGNATSTINSGVMMNKRHHKVINKTSEMTVQRTMRFTLTLA